MKVSDYIVKCLRRRGVRHIFELSGGMITHLLDSLSVDAGIRVVSVHHEQAAAFAADATGRMTGVPGVAIATSGPGATNLLTGIGSCYFDSSPAIFLTGQVNRDEQKGDRRIRQLGFQETDIVSMALPITKAAWRVAGAAEVPILLDRAFALAAGGRPGPVLIDIPMDVQRAQIEEPEPVAPERERPAFSAINCEPIRDALLAARSPLVLAGGGLRAGRASAEFRTFLDTAGIPAVNSLMAVDALPYGHPSRVGMIGTYGNRWANLALSQSDVLLVLGSRLDVRQTGSRTEAFGNGRTIFHVDCDEGEINNRIRGCQAIVTELEVFLPQLTEIVEEANQGGGPRWVAWKHHIGQLRSAWPDTAELGGCAGINPNALMHQLSRHSGRAAAFVVDVGQHQMWAAQSIEVGEGQRFLTSGGMGSMGFALPAAIGAVLAADGRPVVVIAGDGGSQCNIQELQTVARNRLPLKILVLNNRCHGMVRQFQESYFGGRYQSTYWGYSAPDFAAVALAYGIRAATVAEPDEVESALNWLWADSSEPQLLQVMIDPFCNVYPKVAFGQPISTMEPQSETGDADSI
jgi:acetolactate synthase-1/2/3 large subunit